MVAVSVLFLKTVTQTNGSYLSNDYNSYFNQAVVTRKDKRHRFAFLFYIYLYILCSVGDDKR